MALQEIKQIQKYLKDNNIDAYLAFISDDHGSEYVSDRFKTIAFLANFTGSNGLLLIDKNSSYLWTDGRYFLQASEQLKETNTKLMKMGIDSPIDSFILENYQSLMFDFTVASGAFVNRVKSIKLIDDSFLIDSLWENRPAYSNKKIFLLPSSICPVSAKKKCQKAIKSVKSNKDFAILITDLADIAYMTNARGNDIKCNPTFFAYMLLAKHKNKETYNLYINTKKLNKETKQYFKDQNINIKSYDKIYNDVSKLKCMVCFDSRKTNYKLFSLMEIKKDMMLWPTKAKAIKNKIEIKETKKAHVKDAIAMIKFIYYIKNKVGKTYIDELSASDYLEKLRRKQGSFELSFNTICGYNKHGAIIHYGATKETNIPIKPEGLLLVDSGGQYYYGTTDITRTIVVGPITDDMKYHFTLVLKAHIALASAIYDKTTTDYDLDILTRKVIKDANLDYNHGTGHGIGFVLNVHEGPQSISYNPNRKRVVIKPGMITSDEPGLYFENQYGIRHENEILCVKKDKGLYGFETITYVPFDLQGIDVSLLDEKEKDWLNNYHQMIYQKISPFLTKKEKKFLKESTKLI